MTTKTLKVSVADAVHDITLAAPGEGQFSWEIDLGDSLRLVLAYTPKPSLYSSVASVGGGAGAAPGSGGTGAPRP